MTWTHPTGNNPEAIHLVCCGYTARDYISAKGVYGAPVPTDIEVWSLNKGLRSINADFGFVLDDLVGENNKDSVYLRDLRKIASDGCPILTTTLDQPCLEITQNGENWHEYPLLEIRDKLGASFADLYIGEANDKQRRQLGNDLLYMKNSVPMMLAYAWFIGVKTVFLWGADYSHPAGQRKEDDQPNAEFWVGFLKGQGVQVVLSADTTLCSTRDGKWLYGYGARQPVL